MEQLSADQRKLLELAYFEEMGVREAARFLDWHSSKAQRCHESARRRIQELLGVESLDELEIPSGWRPGSRWPVDAPRFSLAGGNRGCGR